MGACVQKQRLAIIKAQDDPVTVVSDAPVGEAKTCGSSFLSEVQDFLAGVDPGLILLDLRLPISIVTNLLKIIGETSRGVPVVVEVPSGSSDPSFFSIEVADKGVVAKPLRNAHLEKLVKKAAFVMHGQNGESNSFCYAVPNIAASHKQARRYGKWCRDRTHQVKERKSGLGGKTTRYEKQLRPRPGNRRRRRFDSGPI